MLAVAAGVVFLTSVAVPWVIVVFGVAAGFGVGAGFEAAAGGTAGACGGLAV